MTTSDDDFVFEYQADSESSHFPQRPARDRVRLCYVEWTWGPGHERCEHLWATTNRRTGRLLIWWNDREGRKDRFGPYCSVVMRPGESLLSAATRALVRAWDFEATESKLEPPHLWESDEFNDEEMRLLVELAWPGDAAKN